MRTKPGAGFSHQPKDTLAAPDTPSFPPSPKKQTTSLKQLSPTTKRRLTSSFSDLVRYTTSVPPRLPHSTPRQTATGPAPAPTTIPPGPPSPAMPRSRSASFSDDDLLLISSSQAQSSQDFGSQAPYEQGGDLMPSPLRPMAPPNDVIDITDSPAASPPKATARATPSATTATARPVFGQPTHMASPVAPRAKPPSSSSSSALAQERRRQEILFNTNRNRAEHHRPQRLTGPLAPPKTKARSVPPPRPTFSSLGSSQPAGGTVYPVSSYYRGNGVNGVSTHADVDVYTDPDKATADLKALLEGGMDDDEDDDDDEQDKKGNAANEPGDAEKDKKPKAKKKAIQDYEGGVVPGINVKLLPHQVEGVKWMQGRELGPVKRGRVPKGGILADDMGLGKTLQSLSLIVTNRRPERDAPGWKKHYESINGNTLVVAPLALIRQWEAEIKEKVCADPPLRVCVHHGPQRTVRPQELARYDVVITTYQILVSEHGHSNDTLKSGCFGVRWWRVILDEAHSIKNRNAKMTKACCALTTEFRWCLSGTPMQNNLDELQSLVNFLRITPYDNLAEWRAHIDAPMKNGRGALAIRRLHSLLRCFMKRRTKDILKEDGALLPGGKKEFDDAVAAAAVAAAAAATATEDGTTPPAPVEPPRFRITERNVVSVTAEFSPAERAFYDNLEERADKSLEKMMKGKAMSYANALVLLLRLRQACNHPDLLNLKLEKDKDALSTDPVPERQPGRSSSDTGSGGADVDALADALGGLGLTAKQCEVCMSDLTKEERTACEEANGGGGCGYICAGCLQDRDVLHGTGRSAKSKVRKEEKRARRAAKLKKKKREVKVDDTKGADDADVVSSVRRGQRKPRNRRAVLDSDDEDEEEEKGTWLVGEEERGELRLGKAGGQEDEDAEGGGDWLNSSDDDDSAHFSHDDDDGSRLDSFIVDDETESQKGRERKNKRSGRKTKTFVDSDSEKDDDDDDDDGRSSRSSSNSASDSDSDSEDDSGISASEVFSTADEDSFLSRGSGKRNKTSGSSSAVMVSAKIRKMLDILQAEADTHKFIVFSQFTSMLDVVAPFLARAGLGYVRYDGGMRNDAREASLRSLRQDARTRVLLCSLKCGALGLNLTAATRVVLLEPFWNPFVEEQAIDRVHRLTQTVDVTVYKLTVADTVEQRILALQDKKRLLAAQALEGGGLGAGGKKGGKKNALKLGLQELMDLFKHSDRDGGAGAEGGPANAATAATANDGGGLLQRKSGNGKSSGSASQESVYGRRW